MEAPRPGRADCLAALSASREQNHVNAAVFINQYLDQIASPLPLMNHTSVITFESYSFDIDERREGLAEYLYLAPPPPSEWVWGRTIIAEKVGKDLIHAALNHPLEASSMYVTLVPTSIDDSSQKGELPPKKGVDHCIVQMTGSPEEQILLPVCGIDVTMGNNDLVKSKRKRPAIQCPIAMPAIVLPLAPLTWEGRKMKSFASYLDTYAREEILAKGTYTPFYGLDETDVENWKHILRDQIQTSLAKCRENLVENAQHPGLVDYPYMDDVLAKVTMMEQIVNEARTHASLAFS